MLKTLDVTFYIGSTQTFLYFNLYLNTAFAQNVRLYFLYRQYTNLFIFRFISQLCLRRTLRLFQNAFYITIPHLISSHLISSRLISSHLISSHLISRIHSLTLYHERHLTTSLTMPKYSSVTITPPHLIYLLIDINDNIDHLLILFSFNTNSAVPL